jgi:hypothetical protein
VPQIKRDDLDKKVEPGIFMGYISTSKVYKVFHRNTRNFLISSDVQFIENEQCNWNHTENKLEADPLQNQHELVNDPLVRGSRLLYDDYQRCNLVFLEPA